MITALHRRSCLDIAPKKNKQIKQREENAYIRGFIEGRCISAFDLVCLFLRPFLSLSLHVYTSKAGINEIV
jgi:hypothetical protein